MATLMRAVLIMIALHGAETVASVFQPQRAIAVAANLTVGITLSSIAQNQLQAMQLTFFYFLPGMLLSGFMFPFRGMPAWAQAVGTIVPMTYFNRLVRGILRKVGVGRDRATIIEIDAVRRAVRLRLARRGRERPHLAHVRSQPRRIHRGGSRRAAA